MENKLGIYWGVLLSNMINFIFPWRFNIFGGNCRNLVEKGNIAGQQLILFFLAMMIVFSFMEELKAANKARKKHYIKISIRNWWNAYENFIYPLLATIDNPWYFLGFIGVNQLIYLFNSFTVPYLKPLAILKALYPIVFHTCFIIFKLS